MARYQPSSRDPAWNRALDACNGAAGLPPSGAQGRAAVHVRSSGAMFARFRLSARTSSDSLKTSGRATLSVIAGMSYYNAQAC